VSVQVPEDLKPLGVWDATLPGWPADAHWSDRIAWAQDHVERSADTYRVEFYVLDTPFAVVRRFALNAGGFKHNGPDGEIAKEPPVLVPLDELPPAHLLRTS
jgi:hypothetical protein